MTKCAAPGLEVAWEVAHEFLWAAGDDPPAPSIGGILGCAVEVSLVVRQKADAHLKRLRLIVLSEIMHLIWKIRCERVIGGKQHANLEVANRAQAAISERFAHVIRDAHRDQRELVWYYKIMDFHILQTYIQWHAVSSTTSSFKLIYIMFRSNNYVTK